jgi:aminopeptidase-like protein
MNIPEDNTVQSRIELYFDRLWPINRSITGPGFRESLDILGEIIPTERLRFETGRKVFDWTVPKEWVAHDAYFVDPEGRRHAEFKVSNLHLMGYSVPFKGTLTLAELHPHLYSLPDMPDAIPYVTSYYRENWGFSLSHNELQTLPDGDYEIYIDTELFPGVVEIGEAVLPGQTDEEILFSTYLCHPSLANNELSGPLVMAFLYECIKNMPSRRYTYRFVMSTETIGTICYLSKRGEHLKNHLVAGYVMTCLGDRGQFTYKLSRRGDSLADRAARIVLRDNAEHAIVPFIPRGSDEKQYCSPGFNLPVGSLMRTRYGHYPEYHTSLDNKTFISFDALAGSVDTYFSIVKALEANLVWESRVQHCTPQLGPRGLFPSVSHASVAKSRVSLEEKLTAMLWFLNLADGQHDLLDIADISGCRLDLLTEVVQKVLATGLIKVVENAA